MDGREGIEGLEDANWVIKRRVSGFWFLVSGFWFLVFFVYCFPSEFDASFFLCISVTPGTTPSWSVYYVSHRRRLAYFMIPQYPFFLSELGLHSLVELRIIFSFVPLHIDHTALRRNYSLVTFSVEYHLGDVNISLCQISLIVFISPALHSFPGLFITDARRRISTS